MFPIGLNCVNYLTPGCEGFDLFCIARSESSVPPALSRYDQERGRETPGLRLFSDGRAVLGTVRTQLGVSIRTRKAQLVRRYSVLNFTLTYRAHPIDINETPGLCCSANHKSLRPLGSPSRLVGRHLKATRVRFVFGQAASRTCRPLGAYINSASRTRPS